MVESSIRLQQVKAAVAAAAPPEGQDVATKREKGMKVAHVHRKLDPCHQPVPEPLPLQWVKQLYTADEDRREEDWAFASVFRAELPAAEAAGWEV